MDLLKQLIEICRESNNNQITISIINKRVMLSQQDIVEIDKTNQIMKAMVRTSGVRYDINTIDQCVIDLLAAKWDMIEIPIASEYLQQVSDQVEFRFFDSDKPDEPTKQ